MDLLYNAALEYKSLLNKEHIIMFSNGKSIRIIFKPSNFLHLAGLHKLTDMDYLTKFSAKRVYKMVLSKKVTMDNIKNSLFFDSHARDRIESLSRIRELLVVGGKVVYGFDRIRCRIRASFKSDIIFFKDDGYNFFITLCMAADKYGSYYYPETIFYHYDNAYLFQQNICSIENIDVVPYCTKRILATR